MQNLKEIMSRVEDPKFRPQLLADNARSVSLYNDECGFGDFKRVMKASRSMSSAEIFRACDLFFTLDRIRMIIGHERECATANPFYGSSFQPIGGEFFGGMVVVSTDDFSAILLGLDGYEIELAKQRVAGDRRTLTFGGQETFLKFFKARDFALRSWEIPEFGDNDDLATMALAAERGELSRYNTGDVAQFGAHQAFEYDAVAGAQALVLQVQMFRGGRSTALEFDVDTRRLVGASAPSQEPTRLQMLATAMRLFGRTDASPEIERLLEHPTHYVRWHAMRELLGLDPDRAWPLLLKMRDCDPQPAVRRAAMATIAQLGGDDAGGAGHLAVAAE